MSFVYTLGGNVVQAAAQGYTDIPVSANTQLAWPTQFQDVDDVTAAVMYISPTAGGFTVTFPNAKLASVGQVLLIVNPTAFNFTLRTFGPTHTTFPVNTGTAQIFILRDNSTTDGSWGVLPAGGGVVAVTSVGAQSAAGATATNLVITGSPITSSGTFTFTLASDLLALTSFDAETGIAVRTGVGTWETREVLGTNNQIVVNNTDGVAGNVIISLPTIITGINNLTVGTLNFSSNVITTLVANQNLLLTPNGTGRVVVNNSGASGIGLDIRDGGSLKLFGDNDTNTLSFLAGNRTTNLAVTLPTTDPALDQVMIVSAIGAGTATLDWETITTFGGPSTVNALARYTDTIGSLGNSVVLLDVPGNLTGINSAVIRNLQIATGSPNTISTVAGNIVLSPNGASGVVTTSDVELTNGKRLILDETTASGVGFTTIASDLLAGATLHYNLPKVRPRNVGDMLYIETADNAGFNYQWKWGQSPSAKNILLNGGISVWQRGISFTNSSYGYLNNSNTYCVDGWKLQSNGNNIVNVTQTAGVTSSEIAASALALRSTVVTANAKWGYVNYFNHNDTLGIEGRVVSIQCWNACTGVTTLKAALLGWTGAADTPTSSIVSSWNVSNTPPTLAANWAFIDSWNLNVAAPFTQTIHTTTVAFGGYNNLALFIWCDSAGSSVAATWDLSCVKMEFGNVCTPFNEVPFSEELSKCKYMFKKDLDYNVALGTTNTFGGAAYPTITASIADTIAYAKVDFESSMFITPAVTTYPIVTTTNTGRWSRTNGVGYVDLAASSANTAFVSKEGFVVVNGSGGALGTTDAQVLLGHWYAESGFNV